MKYLILIAVAFALLASDAMAQVRGRHTGRTRADHTLAADGIHHTFVDQRAVYHNGNVYIGYITSGGDINVTQHNVSTRENTTFTLGTKTVSDHSNPALLVLPSGKILAAYSEHKGEQWWRISTNAEDVTAWDAEQAVGETDATYAELLLLPDESNRVYWFFREESRDRKFRYSDDGGVTWSAETTLIDTGENKPYPKYIVNGTGRIDVVYDEDGPGDGSTNGLYHAYYQASDSTWRQSDGTTINLPLDTNNGTPVYEFASEEVWAFDLIINDSGNPVVAFASYENNPARQTYNVSTWTGSAWSNSVVVEDRGGTINPDGQQEYVGSGIGLVSEDSAYVGFELREQRTGHAIRLMVKEGSSWKGRGEVRGMVADSVNARPHHVDGSDHMHVLFWGGRFDGLTDFDVEMRYSAVPEPASVWEAYFDQLDTTPIANYKPEVGDSITVHQGAITLDDGALNSDGSGASPVYDIGTFDCGVSDLRMEADVESGPVSSAGWALVFRYTGTDDFWSVRIKHDGTVELNERSGGTTTLRGSSSLAGFSTSATYRLVVEADGADVSVSVDGTEEVTYDSATSNQGATRCGVQAENNAAGKADMENLFVYTL